VSVARTVPSVAGLTIFRELDLERHCVAVRVFEAEADERVVVLNSRPRVLLDNLCAAGRVGVLDDGIVSSELVVDDLHLR